jgi:4-diphosphocytidyl-2-C-methyl-D-erythritol kinase
MSGSGATCFGIFPSFETAQQVEASLAAQRPDWYFKATMTKQEAQP